MIAAAAALIVCATGCQARTSPAESGTPTPGPASGTSGDSASSAPSPPTSPPATLPSPQPAALSGGACLLLDFDVIKAKLGTEFNIAAAATTSDTYSCVVQNSAASHPDMVLSITTTDLSATEFKSDAQPSGATAVTKLGKIGYEIQDKPPAGAGPVIEVGWLSGNERLIVLRYTCAVGTSAADVKTLTAKMVTMARTVDATTV